MIRVVFWREVQGGYCLSVMEKFFSRYCFERMHRRRGMGRVGYFSGLSSCLLVSDLSSPLVGLLFGIHGKTFSGVV